MLSAPTCSSVETRSAWSNEPSANGSDRDVGRDALHPGARRARRGRRRRARRRRAGAPPRYGRPRRTRSRPRGRGPPHEPREHPRDLDHALVGAGRRLEPARRSPRARAAEPERDGVVELADARASRRSRARGGRSRARASRPQLRERPLARLGLGRAPQHHAERAARRTRRRPRACASSSASTSGSTALRRTRRSRGRTCGPAGRRRRTAGAAGTARTSGRRAPRAAPP